MNALLCLVKQTFLVEYIFSNDEILNLKLRQSIMFKQKFYFVWYDESIELGVIHALDYITRANCAFREV